MTVSTSAYPREDNCKICTRIDGISIEHIPELSIVLLGLVKGLNEVCKCLDRKQAILCVLADDCDDPKYKKLVTVSISSHSKICKYRPLPRVVTSLWSRSSIEMTSAHGSDIASTTRKVNQERSREPPQSLLRAMVKKLKLSPSFSTISRKSDSTSETATLSLISPSQGTPRLLSPIRRRVGPWLRFSINYKQNKSLLYNIKHSLY